MKKILLLVLCICTLSSCKDKEEKAVEELMTEIRQSYDSGNDVMCLRNIDTLRQRYPKAVEARKEALEIFQKASLRLAQKTLASVDSSLLVEQNKFRTLDSVVAAHKEQGIATEEELTSLTLQRLKRDSLQTRFDVLCAEIRYIRARQKQYADEEKK